MNISVSGSQLISKHTVYLKQLNQFSGYRMLHSLVVFTNSHFLCLIWGRRQTADRSWASSGRHSLYRAPWGTFSELIETEHMLYYPGQAGVACYKRTSWGEVTNSVWKCIRCYNRTVLWPQECYHIRQDSVVQVHALSSWCITPYLVVVCRSTLIDS